MRPSLQDVYSEREQDVEQNKLYSIFNISQFFTIQQRQRHLHQLLSQASLTDLRHKRVLEVGCGRGDVVREWGLFQVAEHNYYGIDLLERVQEAQKTYSASRFAQADAQMLPFASGQFDLVIQYTMFTSILDHRIRAAAAREMQRILAPDGKIIWYDFWLNPTNPNTQGIRKSDIQQLFAGRNCVFKRVTLAPPIARRLVPLSWDLALLLEKIRVLNSHWMVLID